MKSQKAFWASLAVVLVLVMCCNTSGVLGFQERIPLAAEELAQGGIPSLPGFVLVISQSGLDYLEQVGLPILQQQLSDISIPDISGSVGTPIGSVDYTLSNIAITSVTLGDSQLSITSDGISVSISDVQAQCSMDWSYRESSWPHVSDSGSADISTTSTSASVAVSISNVNGGLQLAVDSVSVNIGSLNIDLHGGASWLYQIFVDAFSGEIQSGIQSALQGAISSAITSSANQALQTLPTTEPISSDPPIEIDYQLIGSPTFSEYNYLAVGGLGEFYNTNSPSESPYTPTPIAIGPISQMLDIYLTDYCFNSAGYVAFQENLLETQLTPSMVPSGFPISLNTTKFCFIAPKLCSAYPDAGMVLNISASAPPIVNITATGGAAVTVNGTIGVSVITPENYQIPAFTLNVELFLAGEASIVNQNLQAQLEYVNATLSLESSEVGYVSIFLLQAAADILFSQGLVPILNKDLSQGFPLPTLQGITFQSPTVTFYDGYLGVSTDINYS